MNTFQSRETQCPNPRPGLVQAWQKSTGSAWASLWATLLSFLPTLLGTKGRWAIIPGNWARLHQRFTGRPSLDPCEDPTTEVPWVVQQQAMGPPQAAPSKQLTGTGPASYRFIIPVTGLTNAAACLYHLLIIYFFWFLLILPGPSFIPIWQMSKLSLKLAPNHILVCGKLRI